MLLDSLYLTRDGRETQKIKTKNIYNLSIVYIYRYIYLYIYIFFDIAKGKMMNLPTEFSVTISLTLTRLIYLVILFPLFHLPLLTV